VKNDVFQNVSFLFNGFIVALMQRALTDATRLW